MTQKIEKIEIGTTTITPHQILAGDEPFIIDAANYHGLGTKPNLNVGRAGNVVFIDYEFTPISDGTIVLGKTPYKPHHRLMLPCPAWSTERDKDRVIQINEDGQVSLLNAKANYTYVGQVAYFTSL